MSTTITKYPITTPGDATLDPRLRKSFTYLEANWHTEMNRNWEQTVDQINVLDDLVASHGTRIDSLEAVAYGADITTINDTLATLVDNTSFASFQAAVSLAKLNGAANSGATSLTVTVTQWDVKEDDELLAYDPVAKTRSKVTVGADATAGATTLTVDALSGALGDGTVLYLHPAWVRAISATQGTTVLGLASDLSDLDDQVTANMASISINAGKIATQVTRITVVENDLTTKVSSLQTQITQTANSITLRASSEDVDTLSGRISTAEASITVNADSIVSAVDTVTSVNNTVTSLSSRVTQTAAQIASVLSRTDANEEDISTLSTSITQTADSITSHASKLEDLEGSVVSHSSSITQQATSINSKVAQSTFDDSQLGTALTSLSRAYASEGATSLAVVALSPPGSDTDDVILYGADDNAADEDRITGSYAGGDQLVVINLETGVKYEFEVKTNAIEGAETIDTVGTVTMTAPAGSPVYIVPAFVRSQIYQAADFMRFALYKRDENSPAGPAGVQLVTGIDLELDGITVTADKLVSSNFNGTILANGNIDRNALGTAGWALTASKETAPGSGVFTGGEFLATNAILRGSVTVDVIDNLPDGELFDSIVINETGITLPLPLDDSPGAAVLGNHIHWTNDGVHGGTDAYIGANRKSDGHVVLGVTLYGTADNVFWINPKTHFAANVELNNTVLSNGGVDISDDSAMDWRITDGETNVDILAFYKTLYDATTGLLVTEARPTSDAADAYPTDVRYYRKAEITATLLALSGGDFTPHGAEATAGFQTKAWITTNIETPLAAAEDDIVDLKADVAILKAAFPELWGA